MESQDERQKKPLNHDSLGTEPDPHLGDPRGDTDQPVKKFHLNMHRIAGSSGVLLGRACRGEGGAIRYGIHGRLPHSLTP